MAAERAGKDANVSSSNEDGEGSTDTKQQVVKGKGTGKAKKGKKTRYAAQSYI